MGQALYRKYRSKTFGEVVGQEHVTTTLANAIQTNRISHAYLFTGPRGVGKTSVARILARAVNDLPPDDDAQYLDIIEIDAASNRRIDEIRELRERVHAAPTSAKYKVYIIDEVHMLTKEAFNALLKTLEEPPKHVIFILATTESHKLPETIISRTQRFSFKPITEDDTVKHLRQIAQQEEISISDEALQLIAEHGNGSFRDSISLLDQASNLTDRIEIDQVRELLGLAPKETILALIDIIATGSAQQLFTELETVRQRGYQSTLLAKQISSVLRQALTTDKPELSLEQSQKVLTSLLGVSASVDPDTALELALLGAILSNNMPPAQTTPTSTPPPKAKVEAPKPAPAKQEVAQAQEPSHDQPEQESQADPAPENLVQVPSGELWQETLKAVKQKHTTLYSALRMSTAQIDGNNITILFKFPFHKKRVEEAKTFTVLRDIILQLNPDAAVELGIASKQSAEPQGASGESIDAITNIFGGGEVLES